MTATADIIIKNAKVLTMDSDKPKAEAIALAGNKVLAVGTASEIEALATASTKVVDAGGATVMPGFNEAHMHIFPGSVSLRQLNLHGVEGFEALKAAIQEYAAANPDEPLLMGFSADYSIIGLNQPVTRQHLDAIISDRPFMMFAPDHHTAWANTPALEKAGLLHGKDVGVGNEVVMGEDGLASGELREGNAFGPVAALASTGGREELGMVTGMDPENVTPEQYALDRAILKNGLEYCASWGVTSIQNFDGNHYQLRIMRDLEQSGELPVRIRIPFHMKNFMDLSELDKAAEWKKEFATDMLRGDFVKVFMDGVIDSQTAYMLDGYGDRPGYTYEPLFTPEAFDAIATKADGLGLQIAVHAIGSAAVRQTLDGFEAAVKANGKQDLRHRIEHIEVIHPDDIPRFRELGIVASMQPVHYPGGTCFPAEPTTAKIGEDRWAYAYAWRTMKDAGATVVFASDWPVSPVSPFQCIQDALTRKPWKDGLPDQRFTLEESLEAYTSIGAWVEFAEDRKGKLKPGFLADVVILSHDIESVPADEIMATVRAVTTICDGRISYQAA
ncbi:amidohydrolase [Rhizobium sp. S95]|uniref:Amidohydrolase n=1 Tax=Ciceribacter sichuanensis TaxID=2949647 RepID=A0AAJ1BY05_9HYPH|nr:MULTISPECIES: amidohydrolase [unclassified Ciceribacter]MCM2398326.1 amidohydrolase [Ciceribacter sp. S95]MCO5958331.1 amidohydrolase [Ciceribacter sp. S101]